MTAKYQLYIAVWEITMQCNMKCIHCGTGATLDKRKKELTPEEALDLIGQISDLGAKKVTLSGGEPLLRKDWPILAEEVLKRKMTCGIISNGLLVDEKVIEILLDLSKKGKIFIAFSVDGSEAVHNYIRQNPFSFQKLKNALDLTAKNNFGVAIITQVNKMNFEELPKIEEFIFGYPNVYAWQIQVATPWGRMKEARDLTITPEEYLKLAEFIAREIGVWGKRVVASDDMGYFTDYEKKFRGDYAWSGCYAGIRTLGIRSNGDVSGCLSLMEDQYVEENIRTKKLKEIWENEDGFSYNRKFKKELLVGPCKNCKFGLRCKGGCRNMAISFGGSPFANEYCLYYLLEGKNLIF